MTPGADDFRFSQQAASFSAGNNEQASFALQTAPQAFAMPDGEADAFTMENQADGFSFEYWQGLRGPYYTPFVDAAGVISWTNNGGLPNPAPVNIRGTGLTISGIVEAVVDLPQSGETGETWLVGTESPYIGYMWSGFAWTNIGPILAGPAGQPGEDGEPGEPGAPGAPGAAAGFGTPTATIDDNVGTPAVNVSASGPDTAKVFSFQFRNLKGAKGDPGDDYILTPEDIADIAAIAAASVRSTILNDAYPVGSIYISANSTSPAPLFGGTWERITGKFLLSASDTDGGATTAQRTAGQTGGSPDAIIPYHQHQVGWLQSDKAASGTAFPRWWRWGYGTQGSEPTAWSEYAGTSGNTAGANMPPYLAVYVWQRTA
jgi:hypothetical protein